MTTIPAPTIPAGAKPAAEGGPHACAVPARRHALRAGGTLAAAAALATLGGCAVFRPTELLATVSSWGAWPVDRPRGTFAFERLPSQQAHADLQQQLEDAARPVLMAAGFREAAVGVAPDTLVQLGVRVTQSYSPWDDPFWYGGFGMGAWRYSRWRGPRWGLGVSVGYPMGSAPRYDREAAILLRDRASGQPLYEARASSESYASLTSGLLPLLYEAALKDFPATGMNPRVVRVPIRATR